jgi:hypothetical protein
MTRDDIIAMAREAGWNGLLVPVALPQIERFYALAVAAEREACAKVAEAQGTSSGDRIAEALRARSSI